MIEYEKLTTKEKAEITKVFNAVRARKEAEKAEKAALAKVFAMVKANGSVVKGDDIVSFVAQPETKMVFDHKTFATEHPEVVAEYLTEKVGAREHLTARVK